MSRVNLKVGPETKQELDDVKREGETWDECLQRLVQLERATRMGDNGERTDEQY